jgi:HEAT repeat protein
MDDETMRLIAVLRTNSDWRQREWAAKALGQIGDPAVIPALIQALQDKDDVRLAAVKALREIGYDHAIPALIQALQDNDESVSDRAATALERMGTVAILALIQALQDKEHWRVRYWAAKALGKIGDPAAIPALIEALQDKEWKESKVRLAAAEALGEIGGHHAILALIQALQDKEHWRVCLAAVKALGQIGDPAAIPTLIQALQLQDREYWRVRYWAAKALGKIGDPAAIPALIEALQDKEEHVVSLPAAEALAELASRHPTPALRAALPALRRRMKEAPNSRKQSIFQDALDTIEQAVVDLPDLPLPAAAPGPSVEKLPLISTAPTDASDVSSDCLPIPAAFATKNIDDSPDKSHGATTPPRWSQRLRRFWRGATQ